MTRSKTECNLIGPLVDSLVRTFPSALIVVMLETIYNWRWSTSAPPRCLDGGDVDLLHRHHRLEGTLCLTASSRKRLG